LLAYKIHCFPVKENFFDDMNTIENDIQNGHILLNALIAKVYFITLIFVLLGFLLFG